MSKDQYTCLHCGRNYRLSSNRQGWRLKLCSPCWESLTIRHQYVIPASQTMDFYGGHQLPSVPTSARPGSDEKMEILAARVKMRVSLWHPDDEPANGD